MTTVGDVTAWLDGFAPPRFAETWDNVGLLLGDPAAPVARIMTCLTLTPESCGEAVDERADLVVSHHPILFREVKKIRSDRLDTQLVWTLARSGIALHSPHTAFDNTKGGINDELAELLGLEAVHPLKRASGTPIYKVVVFCPRDVREPVLEAAFAAGAGHLADYRECSYSSTGIGTFYGEEGSNPAVGQKGRRETVREWRVEMIVPEEILPRVLEAVRGAHSYEEPAIDVYPTIPPFLEEGHGRLGRLSAPLELDAFALRVAEQLDAPDVQVVGDPGRNVSRVAIVCGAGDSFIEEARKAGADVLLTGEVRFHRALDARTRGLALIAAGHHATERRGVEGLARRLREAFPEAGVWPSRREIDPFRRPTPLARKKSPGKGRGV